MSKKEKATSMQLCLRLLLLFTYPLKELWHGTRWKELSWFWDPRKEFILPHRCKTCECILSVDEFKFNDPETDLASISCPQCFSTDEFMAKKAKGDPRNLAFILHWDGWSPGFAKTSSARSCGEQEKFSTKVK